MKYKILFLSIILVSILFIKDKKEFFFGDFKIQNIQINELNNLSKKDIDEKIGSINLYQKNLLFTDMQTIYDDLKSMPIVENVLIRKIIPNTLSIEIKERFPIALITDNNKNYIFDESSAITLVDENSLKDFDLFKRLLYFEGNNILSEIPFLVDIFLNKDFSKRINGLYKIGDRRWDMIVDKKIKVMLPERISKDLIVSIVDIIDQMKSKNNIKIQAVYTILDLRLKDKIFIKNIGE
jgi:cell division protein FtsQ